MATKRKVAPKARTRRSAKKNPVLPKLKRASRLFLPLPLFAFLLLAVGVLLVNWTFNVGAIDYLVKAKVPAEPLTEPAIITSPANGAKFKKVPVTVRGSCPLDSYVELYRNGLFSGTAICDSDQRFEISTDLFVGQNSLKARVFNITDDEGPQSDPITVYYTPPVPITPDDGSPSPSRPETNPLALKSDFKYRGFQVGDVVRWELEIAGGRPPYAIDVDWGDGESSLISRTRAGKFTIIHKYEEEGGYKGSYTIKIKASDSVGGQTFLQFFVLVNPKGAPFVSTSTGQGSDFSGFSISREWLQYMWPAYGIVVLMTISFWLGEREELAILKRRRAVLRRR